MHEQNNKWATRKWLESVQFGGGCINNNSFHFTNPSLPFGGRGNSGIGSYHGRFSFENFSHKKAIMKTPLWFNPALKYPPFKGKLGLFKLLSDYPQVTLHFVSTTNNLADFLTREGLPEGDLERFNLQNINIKDFYCDLPKQNFSLVEWINFVDKNPQYLT